MKEGRADSWTAGGIVGVIFCTGGRRGIIESVKEGIKKDGIKRKESSREGEKAVVAILSWKSENRRRERKYMNEKGWKEESKEGKVVTCQGRKE